jgi:hypothetical protein
LYCFLSDFLRRRWLRRWRLLRQGSPGRTDAHQCYCRPQSCPPRNRTAISIRHRRSLLVKLVDPSKKGEARYQNYFDGNPSSG